MEAKRDRRKVWLAVLASVVLHLVIGLALAAFAGKAQPLTPLGEEETPVQLTVMNLPQETPAPTPPPLVPKNTLTTTVDPSRASQAAPNEKTFEANANSIAASEKAATSDSFLPGQDGKERPFTNLEEHEQSFAREGAAPQPAPKPTVAPKASSTPEASVEPTPTPPPDSDQLALLTQTPTPIPSPPAQEERTEAPSPIETPTPTPESSVAPASEYRDLQQKTVIRGGITNRGRSAVNAVGTPLGRYKKQLEDAIGSRWYYYINARIDLAAIGVTTITFDIGPDGRVTSMRMAENTANEASASIALRSIQETKFPPIPDDLLATLPDGHLKMEESFTIFANQ